jgi:hypothetical protein
MDEQRRKCENQQRELNQFFHLLGPLTSGVAKRSVV